jgi:multiple sugar transport system ATP-binding protein
MSEIDLRQVGKAYGSFEALRGIDLKVEKGEFVVLVGPSGCGKTTLLRMIAGLEDISDGELLIGGKRMNAVRARFRDVAMIFQNYALYPHMTVAENIGFALKVHGARKAERERRVAEVAATLGLEGVLGRKPRALSGGQRQRVAIGRAIIRRPSVFLMDEPLSNLDAKLRVEMRTELRDLRARLGVTTVYVTHDQIEAMTLGTRVAVLRPLYPQASTNLQQFAPPETLFRYPANVFVAGFIGTPAMNLLICDLLPSDAGAVLDLGRVRLPISKQELRRRGEALAHRVGGRVIVGIRPTDFVLQSDSQGAIQALVDDTELLGEEYSVIFSLPLRSAPFDHVFDGEGQDLQSEQAGEKTTKVVARIPTRNRSIRRGEQLPLTINLERIHFFDVASGRNLADCTSDREPVYDCESLPAVTAS